MRTGKLWWAWLATAALSGMAAEGRAQDLSHDTARVERAWALAGARVARLAPLFAFSGQTIPLRIPDAFTEPQQKVCTTVVALGSRTTTFSIESSRTASDWAASKSDLMGRRSVAGVVVVVRCGRARPELANLALRMSSPRGAVEFLVAQGARPAPAVDHVLPEREAGPSAPAFDVGRPPLVEQLLTRLGDAERRIQGSAGVLIGKHTVVSDSLGRGNQFAVLAEGCHRMELLPEVGRSTAVDLDAEIRDTKERLLARDRSNATDAILEMCVGEETRAALFWAGTVREGKVVLVHGHWPLPKGIPTSWGPRARAALSAAQRRRVTPSVSSPPQWEGWGVPGRTVVSVEVEPDGCYLFGAGVSRGESRSLLVVARAGAALTYDMAGTGFEGAMVRFCASGSPRVMLEVDAVGQHLGWVAGLWKTGRVALGMDPGW